MLHEAQGYADIAGLSRLVFPMTPAVLRALVQVMATIDPRDVSLIDLYHNRGNADPMLIACAVAARNNDAVLLFGEEWIVVSDDHAVQSKAREFNFLALSTKEFLAELEAQFPQH